MEANRLTASDVKDWCWFNGIESLELWEKKAIGAIDRAWMSSQRKA